MPTREQLINALRQADSNGDTQAATRFAEMIKAGQFDGAQPSQAGTQAQTRKPPQQAPQQLMDRPMIDTGGLTPAEMLEQGRRDVRSRLLGNIGRAVVLGGGESALSMLSGAVAEPVAGIAGGLTGLFSMDAMKGADMVERVRNALTLSPRSEEGKQGLRNIGETIAPIAEPITNAVTGAGTAIQKATGSNIAPAAFETAVYGLPEILGLGKLVKPAARAVDVPNAETIRAGQQAAEATGIELTRAQQLDDPNLLSRQSYVAQLSAGSQRASETLARQNQQAATAVENFLADLAPDDSIVRGADQFRSAAQRSIENLRTTRRERSSPLYNEAFDEARQSNLRVDVNDIRSRFSSIADEFPESGKIRNTINKALGFLESGDLKRLHNAKLEIDDLIYSRGDDAVGNTAKNQLLQIKNDLVDRLAEASPKYEQARATFEQNSPAIRQMEDSIIGKVANMDDTQLKNISSRIFDATNINPSVIQNAKRIISEIDPNAWNMLMRSEIEKRMGNMKTGVSEGVQNAPANLHNAIFGNDRQKAALMAGADGKTLEAMQALDTALNRARKGRKVGSDTAQRQAQDRDLRGGAAQWVRNLFQSPISTLVNTGADTMYNRRVSALANALFDPKYQVETTRLLKTGRDKELTRLILSIEALKASQQEPQEEPQQEAQTPQ